MPCAPAAPSSGPHQPDVSTCDASRGEKHACGEVCSLLFWPLPCEDKPQVSCCSKQGEGHREQTWTPPAAAATSSEALAGPRGQTFKQEEMIHS